MMTFDDSMLPTIDDPAISLVRDDRGLALVGEGMELRCDLTGMLPRIKPGRLSHELLVRAARVKGVDQPRAIDATAGFGEDALLLAAAGFHVQLFEHDPVIAALLADGLAFAHRGAHAPDQRGQRAGAYRTRIHGRGQTRRGLP